MTTNRILTPVRATPPRPPGLNLVTSSVLIGPDDDETDGRWTGGFAYAPENQFPGVNRETCNETSYDQPAIAAPSGVVATAVASGGSLTAGLKSYQVTYVDANGETTGSTVATCTVVLNGQATITWPAPTEIGVTSNVYGRVAGSIAKIASNVTGGTFTDSGAATPSGAVPGTNTTGGPGTYTNLPNVNCLPWVVVVEDSCSSFGFEARDYIGRATRLLDNATPNAIESEWWTGALTTAAGTGNNFLTNTATVTNVTPGATTPTNGTPCSIARGVQILEDALYSSGFGGQGMIHTMPQTAPNFLGARRVGAQLLTVMDNIVVPGSGYPGTGPGGLAPTSTTAWMYATDVVTVRLDKPQVFPDNFQEALDRGFSGEPNKIRFRAERFVAATADFARHFAVNVTLAT